MADGAGRELNGLLDCMVAKRRDASPRPPATYAVKTEYCAHAAMVGSMHTVRAMPSYEEIPTTCQAPDVCCCTVLILRILNTFDRARLVNAAELTDNCRLGSIEIADVSPIPNLSQVVV